MIDFRIIKLHLQSSLYYRRDDSLEPFDGIPGRANMLPGSEFLFAFTLDPVQAQSIEPDRGQFPGQLLFRGLSEASGVPGQPASPELPARGDQADRIVLPRGIYLFAQVRELLNREDFIDMAIEVQKDGLWERYTPDSRLYLRYLYEEASPVTQIFRPLREP
jgi:hypothetical protein